MNSTSQFVFSPKLIFVIVAGLIVLAMIMGRKQGETHRTHFGWWIGLGVLLVIASSFLGYSRVSLSPVVEERHSGRSAFNKAMTEMKEQIHAGVDAARDSMKDGLEEVSKGMEEAQESLGSAVRESRSTNKSKKTGTTSAKVTSSTPPVPREEVKWTVEVKDRERSTQQQLVEEKLLQKAAASVNRWVNERMPVKTYSMYIVAPQWLKDNGAFPKPVDIQTEEIKNLNTSGTDRLHGGTLTVVLPPNMQTTLLELGYQELEQKLESDKLEVQGVMFIIVMGITGFVGLLGLVKFLATGRVNAG